MEHEHPIEPPGSSGPILGSTWFSVSCLGFCVILHHWSIINLVQLKPHFSSGPYLLKRTKRRLWGRPKTLPLPCYFFLNKGMSLVSHYHKLCSFKNWNSPLCRLRLRAKPITLTRWRQGGSRVQGHLPCCKASLGCALLCFQTNNSLGGAWQGEKLA